MHKIEFYLMPDEAVGRDLKVPVVDRDFSELLNDEERGLIEENWKKVLEESSGKAFYKPKGVGCLYECSSGNPSFITSDFKTYVAISRNYTNPIFSNYSLNGMRVSAVGGVVRTNDGKIFVHKRSKKATHVAGAVDSSIAGICHVKEGYLDFKGTIMDKLEKELKTSSEDVLDVRFTGIHSSREPDFSGMYTFDISANLDEPQLRERAESSPFEEFYFVDENKLEDFVLRDFNPSQPICLDGCATFLKSMPRDSFDRTVYQLKRNGIEFYFGDLKR